MEAVQQLLFIAKLKASLHQVSKLTSTIKDREIAAGKARNDLLAKYNRIHNYSERAVSIVKI